MDNVVKIIADSLNQIAYRDDTQIVDCQCRKFYSDNPEGGSDHKGGKTRMLKKMRET